MTTALGTSFRTPESKAEDRTTLEFSEMEIDSARLL
jgi:hypothetical protein